MGIFDFFAKPPCPECEKLKAELKKFKAEPSPAEFLSKSIATTIKNSTANPDSKVRKGAFLLTVLHPGGQGEDPGLQNLVRELQEYYSFVSKAVHQFNGDVDQFNLLGVDSFFFGPDCNSDCFFAAQEIRGKALASFPRGITQLLYVDSLFSSVMGDPEIRMSFVTIGPSLVEVKEALPGLVSHDQPRFMVSPDFQESLSKAFPEERVEEKQLPSGKKILVIQGRR